MQTPKPGSKPGSKQALDRDWIAAHLPHQGAMCLLDAVVDWNDDSIRCIASGLDAPGHPLREAGRLPALAGIEYAAQAMALHGALRARGASGNDTARRPQVGYLASVRKVDLHADRLDTLPGSLTVHAERISGDGAQMLYAFTVCAGDQPVLSGRAAVVLEAERPLP